MSENLNIFNEEDKRKAAGLIPGFNSLRLKDSPKDYIVAEDLGKAVKVAVMLGQPLLVTGEPGTGKTQLAGRIAMELGLGDPLVFQTKTTSRATDLFYHYDMLHRYQDVQFGDSPDAGISKYITYRALGKAVLFSNPPDDIKEELGVDKPVRSVVLIDEVDKAPRDFPNDILNEIENMKFEVKELQRTFEANPDYHPIVILTSNSEKNLPEAFLRRCAFYHISFPEDDQLREIIKRRLGNMIDFKENFINSAIAKFKEIRKLALKKKPSTAELLAWVKVLDAMELNPDNLKQGQAEAFAISFSILAKTNEDFKVLKKAYQ